MKFEGDTGPYVQYTHARGQSILRKAQELAITGSDYALDDANAWVVVKQLEKFPEIVKEANDRFEPSVIAKYTLKLSQAFNRYYGNSKILADDGGIHARLGLVQATATVLKESLRLLGIKAPEQM